MLFQSALGVEMTTVPYKGTGPAMTDLIGGQIDLMCDQTTNTTAQIEGKKVKVFAVTTPKRLSTPALKDLPTLDEAGLKGFQVAIWHALYAPKGTPKEIVDKLNKAAVAALAKPEVREQISKLGGQIIGDSPEAFRAFLVEDKKRWAEVIKKGNITPE